MQNYMKKISWNIVPQGTIENSPPIYWWGKIYNSSISPVGTVETCGTDQQFINRPGTHIENLYYSQR